MQIKKILVANRGEIALRVMRTCKEMNIQTVAIFSEADRHSPHVRYADQAVCVGKALSSESYLRMDKIIEICHELGVDAVHPGYGFLSENAVFAKKMQAANLIFIAPSPESIEIMGDKLSSKLAVSKYGNIPQVPGMKEAITDIAFAKQKADEIGYPIMIKASAGGGGKGMRIVENPKDFEEQMERAISEAVSSFANGSVFVEKFITSPKHIEIQVLGDQQGNIVYLFERDCSVQRRNQKVVEEAPSAVLTPEVRKKMGEAAVSVAQACNYYGAGTVEFIVDDKLNFYFLEMNTRLQVEHPVTELITGIDLVKQQILVAEGKSLSFSQEDLKIRGHAIEIRVYAEDPANGFLPDIGKLQTYIRPQGSGLRVDDGFEQGMDIPIYYDPMIAKLIAYGENRAEAIQKMIRAIEEYQITGIQTTLDFCKFVMNHESFKTGDFNTKFVEKYFTPDKIATQLDEDEKLIAASLVNMLMHEKKSSKGTESKNSVSKWRQRAF